MPFEQWTAKFIWISVVLKVFWDRRLICFSLYCILKKIVYVVFSRKHRHNICLQCLPVATRRRRRWQLAVHCAELKKKLKPIFLVLKNSGTKGKAKLDVYKDLEIEKFGVWSLFVLFQDLLLRFFFELEQEFYLNNHRQNKILNKNKNTLQNTQETRFNPKISLYICVLSLIL